MAGFKYDIVTLIELVESNPCIWDKTNENNKNKILRDKSWQEVFQYLEDGYNELSRAEKKKTGEIIMAKCSHIRDAFMRSLRTKSGQGAKKRYIYSEHLQFLLKIAEKEETRSNFSQAATENDNEVEEFEDPQQPTLSSQYPPTESQQPTPSSSQYPPKSTSQTQPASSIRPPISRKHVSKSKRQLDDIEREILSEFKKGKQSVEPDNPHYLRSDKELLLLSFLPYVRDMNETELLDFQMEVLTTIKKIKQRRASPQQTFQQQYINSPQPSPTLSHSESYQSSLQSFNYPSPSQQQSYTGTNKYQQLFDDTTN